MAENKKLLMYKGKPLVREKNLIVYGDMKDKFYLFLMILTEKKLDDGKTVDEISKQLGMKPEEVFRLSDFTREEFLDMMTKGVNGYSRAVVYKKI